MVDPVPKDLQWPFSFIPLASARELKPRPSEDQLNCPKSRTTWAGEAAEGSAAGQAESRRETEGPAGSAPAWAAALSAPPRGRAPGSLSPEAWEPGEEVKLRTQPPPVRIKGWLSGRIKLDSPPSGTGGNKVKPER